MDLFLALEELAVVIAFALVAIGAKGIDRGGFLASIAVGYSIILGGGWTWFVVIATFFVLGVGFTWYNYGYKKSLGSAQEKGGARNWPNILANGGVAAVFGLCEFFFGGAAFTYLYLGAISAAGADTVATELGLLSRSWPRLITNFKERLSPGTSGGVTVLGFAGTLLASLVIGLIAALLLATPLSPPAIVAIAVAGGVAGSVVDSLAGALIQRKSVCVVCGRPSENLAHCDAPTRLQSGFRLIDNNVVNIIATVAGAAASVGLALVLH